MKTCKLMAHLVAGYPDLVCSRELALGLAEGGAEYIEVQFPFSDPSSDGPVIERACQTALDGGFKVKDGFAFMRSLADTLSLPLFIMTYGSLVFAPGVENFVRRAADNGVHGLIIPDLPPDYDERLFELGDRHGVAVVPVIAPEITAERLELIGRLRPEFIYTALRLGITGSRTNLDERTIQYLARVSRLGAKIVAGFGVRSHAQMVALAGHAEAAAVGSYFLDSLNTAEPGTDPRRLMIALAKELKEG